jgi:DNA-binding NarL/FixJ family response regulator
MAQVRQVRVLTVDSRPIIHAGVRQLLASYGDIAFIGAAYNREEALLLSRRHRPDVVLAEIADLGERWLDGLEQLRQTGCGAVVVFTSELSHEHCRQLLRSGVQGVLLKHVQALTLAQALRSIAAGQQVFDPEVTRAALMARPEVRRADFLSDREREVLALLATGLSNDAIGRRLYVSRATVKFHCTNIFGKLGVRTRAQAVALAYKHQLVPLVVVENEAPSPPLLAERSVGEVVARGA